MTLNNTQYNTIIHAYEERQTKNRHILESRRADVYANVDGYRELDESIASISVEQGKKLLSGDDGALEELKHILKELTDSKTSLLTFMTAKTVRIRGMLTGTNAIASARRRFPSSMSSPISAVCWKKKIFLPFLMSTIRVKI